MSSIEHSSQLRRSTNILKQKLVVNALAPKRKRYKRKREKRSLVRAKGCQGCGSLTCRANQPIAISGNTMGGEQSCNTHNNLIVKEKGIEFYVGFKGKSYPLDY